MSSLLRRLERKGLRSKADYETPARPLNYIANGGYAQLHPTRGWKTTSGKRLEAQGKLQRMKAAIDHRMGRVSLNQSQVQQVMQMLAQRHDNYKAAQELAA